MRQVHGISAKVITLLAELKIWLGNGMAYFNDVKYPVMLSIPLKLYFPWMSIPQIVLCCVVAILIMTFVGWFDLKFIKLHQRQAELSTEKYNPYFSKLKKRLK